MNVILEYTNFLYKSYIDILKILLGKNYNEKLISSYVSDYINFRYYDTFELNSFLSYINEKYNSDMNYIRSINELFKYIMYLDDIGSSVEISNFFSYDIVDSSLYFDDDGVTHILYNSINDFLKKKDSFFSLFDTKYFELVFDKISDDITFVDITHNIKISKLYSEFAKDKAFKSPVVYENMHITLCYLISKYILDLKIKNNSISDILIDFPTTLFSKQRKIDKFLNVIDNDLIRKTVYLKISFSKYLEFKSIVDKLISKGFKICIIVDNSFVPDSVNLDSLIIFDKIIISKEYDNYEYLKNNRNVIKSQIIYL